MWKLQKLRVRCCVWRSGFHEIFLLLFFLSLSQVCMSQYHIIHLKNNGTLGDQHGPALTTSALEQLCIRSRFSRCLFFLLNKCGFEIHYFYKNTIEKRCKDRFFKSLFHSRYSLKSNEFQNHI